LGCMESDLKEKQTTKKKTTIVNRGDVNFRLLMEGIIQRTLNELSKRGNKGVSYMMKSKFLVLLSMCMVFAMAGLTFAQGNMNGNMNRSGKSDKMGQMGKMMRVNMTPEQMDMKFVMDAYMGNMAEIEMGRMAMQRASDAEVKNFAQMMIDHHTRANTDLMAIAGRMGMSMTFPKELDPHHRAVMDGMMKFSGMQFDMGYIKGQVADHAMAVDMYMMHSKSSKNREVKDYAKRGLPAVESHYNMAKMIDMRMHMAMMPSMMRAGR
jgi:putative membrane protein